MQSFRRAILGHVRVPVSMKGRYQEDPNGKYRILQLLRSCSTGSSINQDEVMDRVVSLLKKFDKIESAMVTETADFEKDLSLDSLDRVELVMAFEGEFSIEIPDAEADKLKCCADVAKYIAGVSSNVSETS